MFKIASDPKHNGYEKGLASMVYKFLIKNLLAVVPNLHQTNNSQMNFISQSLENLKDAKFIILLKTIFGALILLIRSYKQIQQRF